MRSTFLAFETSKRSIQAAQKSLDITGNNLSNINTEGYTRQRVDLYARYASTSGNRWISNSAKLSIAGQGVNAAGVAQLRDPYVDKRYRENVAIEAGSDVSSDILSSVEDALDNIDSDGLQYYTEEFYVALQKYATEKPDSVEVASLVRNSALNLVQLLHDYDSQLQQIEDTTVYELEESVSHVNQLMQKVADLNEQIKKEYANTSPDLFYQQISVTGSYGPNELLDARNLLLDELATYGNIAVESNEDGSVNVTMGGTTVIADQKVNRIIMQDYEDYGSAVLNYESGNSVTLSGGIIKSYQNMLNGNGVYATGNQSSEHGIAYFRTALDTFARTVSSVMNKGNGSDKDTGREMFSSGSDAIITAGNIRISDDWMADSTMIGQVRYYDEDTGTYKYGYDKVTNEDGTVTLQNSNVQYLLSQFNSSHKFGTANDFGGNFYEYISFVSNRLAQKISYVDSQYETAEATSISLLETRDSLSAVDMDEEGVNMLNYQKWYNASARMLTALDEQIDKLINGTGRVGL